MSSVFSTSSRTKLSLYVVFSRTKIKLIGTMYIVDHSRCVRSNSNASESYPAISTDPFD